MVAPVAALDPRVIDRLAAADRVAGRLLVRSVTVVALTVGAMLSLFFVIFDLHLANVAAGTPDVPDEVLRALDLAPWLLAGTVFAGIVCAVGALAGSGEIRTLQSAGTAPSAPAPAGRTPAAWRIESLATLSWLLWLPAYPAMLLPLLACWAVALAGFIVIGAPTLSIAVFGACAIAASAAGALAMRAVLHLREQLAAAADGLVGPLPSNFLSKKPDPET